VKAGHKFETTGQWVELAEVVRDCLRDPLGFSERNVGRRLRDLLDSGYDRRSDGDNGRVDWSATVEFTENADAYVWYLRERRKSGGAPIRPSHDDLSVDAARATVVGAFRTFEAYAESKGLVPDEYQNHAEANALDTTIGVIYNRFEHSLPKTVDLLDPDDEPGAVAIQGLPGNGKSGMAGLLAESAYMNGEKVLDMLDFSAEFENGTYDVPQNQTELREIRRDLDLPMWYDDPELGHEPPRVEILHPLTPELCDADLPYDTRDGGFVVRPYTIPAAQVEKRVLKAMLTHTTTVQSSTLERAFKKVNDRDDWSLQDLADVLMGMAGTADEGVIRRLCNILGTLDQSGFISTKSDPYTIDWGEIFRDTDTITAFSVGFMGDTAEKLMVMSYLINVLLTEREELDNLPPATAVFRELHLIARAKGWEDQRENEIGRAIKGEFDKLSTLHRHVDLRMVADSQQFERQIDKDVRENFDAGFTFRSKYDQTRSFFKQLAGGADQKYLRKVANQFGTGDAAYVGESSVQDRAFHMPIQVAPRISHHVAKEEDSGLQCRADYLDREELRPAPWSVDTRSDVEAFMRTGRRQKPGTEKPVALFCYHFVSRKDPHAQIPTQKFRDAFHFTQIGRACGTSAATRRLSGGVWVTGSRRAKTSRSVNGRSRTTPDTTGRRSRCTSVYSSHRRQNGR
jgi:hypothetical protein